MAKVDVRAQKWLRNTCAVKFDANAVDGGIEFGLDQVTPAWVIVGRIASVSADGLAIREIEDVDGVRHKPNAYTYRLPSSYYPCAVFAVLDRCEPRRIVMSVREAKKFLKNIIHDASFRGAVIGHDLERSCLCVERGWGH